MIRRKNHLAPTNDGKLFYDEVWQSLDHLDHGIKTLSTHSLFCIFYSFFPYELNQIGIKIDMYRQEYRFTPAFAFIQAV